MFIFRSLDLERMLIWQKIFYEKVLFITQLSSHLMRYLLKKSQMLSIMNVKPNFFTIFFFIFHVMKIWAGYKNLLNWYLLLGCFGQSRLQRKKIQAAISMLLWGLSLIHLSYYLRFLNSLFSKAGTIVQPFHWGK